VGRAAPQTTRLQRRGLKEVFCPRVISEQVGVAKPDLRIFEHALALMGHPPRDQVPMVGDNPHSDIRGGLDAGLHTCWLNANGHGRPDDIAPHYQPGSLTELQASLLA
jgi:putative hydrolase of the HAD superfamily